MSRCAYALAALLAVAPIIAPAQMQRSFPRQALRGEIKFGVPPSIKLNGEVAQLAPGVRIRGKNNMIEMSGALVDLTIKVNYTIDTLGLVKDVWILRDEEIAQLWPKTVKEAATWSFDEVGQVWIKP